MKHQGSPLKRGPEITVLLIRCWLAEHSTKTWYQTTPSHIQNMKTLESLLILTSEASRLSSKAWPHKAQYFLLTTYTCMYTQCAVQHCQTGTRGVATLSVSVGTGSVHTASTYGTTWSGRGTASSSPSCTRLLRTNDKVNHKIRSEVCFPGTTVTGT